MAVIYKTFPATPRKIVTEPKWDEDGNFLGAQVTYTAAIKPAGLSTDIGSVTYWKPAEEMTPAELQTYGTYAADFDVRAVEELGCVKV